jgi:hypothetical protein
MENKEYEEKLKEMTTATGSLVVNLLWLFAMSAIIMLFWNWSIPAIFALPKLSYFKALCIYALVNIFRTGGYHERKD